MTWTDTLEIAIALSEQYPDTDPQYVRFTDLRSWVCDLPGFEGKADHCNERILEAIQMAWIEEAD